ncbi:MAG: glycosyltransferase family 4 protein, partial [Sinobacteraceae bacterium]|nr:glycosyltransferase family 4 protein [Nevskiaceae bacterium]
SDQNDTPDRYRVIRVGNDPRPPRFGYLWQAVPLYKALEEIRPRAIYQRVACGYTGVCAYYARRHEVNLVWHVAHDSDVSPEMSLDGRNPIRRFLEKRSVEYGIRRASRIVTQTQKQANLLERNYRRKADAVIPNFHPSPDEKLDKSGELTVTWIAGIKPWKRPEAFLNLADALRDLDVRFVMVGANSAGKGEKQWADEIQQRIGRTPNVQYLGVRSQSEVNALLARSHLFVNTSQHEGFPNTFIQAWMREVPVVSLQVDPDGALAREDVGVACNDSEGELAAAVRSLIVDPNRRAGLGRKAREYAIGRHSMANATGLAELLDTGGRPH